MLDTHFIWIRSAKMILEPFEGKKCQKSHFKTWKSRIFCRLWNLHIFFFHSMVRRNNDGTSALCVVWSYGLHFWEAWDQGRLLDTPFIWIRCLEMVLKPSESKKCEKICEFCSWQNILDFQFLEWIFCIFYFPMALKSFLHIGFICNECLTCSSGPRVYKKYKPYDHTTHRTDMSPPFVRTMK